MKYINILFLSYSILFFLTGCCSYCAPISGHELIGITLIDKNTGEQILLSGINQEFLFLSEADNPSKLSGSGLDLVLDLSNAKKKGMNDKLTFVRRIGSDYTIAEFVVEYEIYGDSDCCDLRSVKVKNFRNNCTNPNVELIMTGGRVDKIKIMVDL
ncbi:MAG: hypothetical protein AB8F94_24845 [Saprospiraceae bacterium]